MTAARGSDGLLSQAMEMAGDLVRWRREIHQWPELGFEEVRTARLVVSSLRQMDRAGGKRGGWRIREGVGRTGVVADLGSAEPVVALRADMDALPIQETTALPYASRRPGLMHACGHDAHVAILLGAARLLSGRRLPGAVRLLFQPSEEAADSEGFSGAARMIQDGAMEGVSAVFGLHVITELPTGTVGVRAGAVQAASDSLQLVVKGCGAHAAQPHRSRDPIYIASQLVSSLQSVVSRSVDPLAPAVVSLGTISGGTRANIIPESVVMTGTIRTLDERTREAVHSEIRQIAPGIAAALGGSCEVGIGRGYPVTVNDGALTDLVRQVAEKMLGAGAVRDIEPSMGAEDFSLLAQQCRGCFFRLGVTPEGQEPTWGHSPTFEVDEAALPIGAALLAGCALRYLTQATGAGD
ncbi:MAG: amidohydrolase [Anaerolineae bacterium]|nr:amidohydrolase [Anaerolineae bacterium]